MSRATLYKVYKTKRTQLAEFSNSHGSAPPVWEWLAVHHLGASHYYGVTDSLWKLAKDTQVPVDVRLCHAFTFDYAVVPPEHFGRMSEACAAMNRILEVWPEWKDYVNHWGAFSELFKTLKVDKRCVGIGMRCTSVADIWDNYPRYGKEKMFDCVNYVLSKAT